VGTVQAHENGKGREEEGEDDRLRRRGLACHLFALRRSSTGSGRWAYRRGARRGELRWTRRAVGEYRTRLAGEGR
jgi:hypothetical protein